MYTHFLLDIPLFLYHQQSKKQNSQKNNLNHIKKKQKRKKEKNKTKTFCIDINA